MIQYDSWCCQSCSSFTRSSTFSFASRHALNRCTWQKKFKVKYREKQQKMAKGITKSWHQKHGKMWVLKLRKSVPPALSDPTTSSKRRSSARCDSSPGNLQEREKGKVTGNFPQFPGLPGYLQRVTPSYRPVTSVRNDLKEPRVPTFQTKDQQNFDGVAERYLSQGKVMTSVLECLKICFFAYRHLNHVRTTYVPLTPTSTLKSIDYHVLRYLRISWGTSLMEQSWPLKPVKQVHLPVILSQSPAAPRYWDHAVITWYINTSHPKTTSVTVKGLNVQSSSIAVSRTM